MSLQIENVELDFKKFKTYQDLKIMRKMDKNEPIEKIIMQILFIIKPSTS